jgi:two-component system, OmpR family, alkaline phosphatase synthesis response regulator PhoP
MLNMDTKTAINILLGDGNGAFTQRFTDFLDEKDYVLRIAPDQKAVFTALKKSSPELLLLDIGLPNGDGIETLKLCRSQHLVPPSTLIAILSTMTDDFTQVLALEAGADDFISKATHFPTLIARIKALLRRRSIAVETMYQKNRHIEIGNLLLNKDAFTAILNSTILDLARKEFDLLFLLASNAEKVFTREELIEKIWGVDTAAESRTLDVHIRKLREKMGDDYIKTHKGIGYRFVKQ